MVIPFLRLNIHSSFSIKKGRLDEAEQSLIRVFGSDYDAKQDVINISENLQHLRNVTHFKLDLQFAELLHCAHGKVQFVVKYPRSNYVKCI